MRMIARALPFALLALLAAPLYAQAPTETCPAAPGASTRPVVAALSQEPQASPAPPLVAPGVPADVTLAPMAKVKVLAPLGKPAAAGDMGGLLYFDARQAGVYRVLLGGHVWIDLVEYRVTGPGETRTDVPASVDHGHSTCAGYAKFVDFRLVAGRNLIQLSGASDAKIALAVVPQP